MVKIMMCKLHTSETDPASAMHGGLSGSYVPGIGQSGGGNSVRGAQSQITVYSNYGYSTANKEMQCVYYYRNYQSAAVQGTNEETEPPRSSTLIQIWKKFTFSLTSHCSNKTTIYRIHKALPSRWVVRIKSGSPQS